MQTLLFIDTFAAFVTVNAPRSGGARKPLSPPLHPEPATRVGVRDFTAAALHRARSPAPATQRTKAPKRRAFRGNDGTFTIAQIPIYEVLQMVRKDNPGDAGDRRRRPASQRCARVVCHYPNGKGRSRQGGVAGPAVSLPSQTLTTSRTSAQQARRSAAR